MKHCKSVVSLLTLIVITVSALSVNEIQQFSADVTLTENGDVYEFFSSGYPPHEIDNSVNPNAAAVKNFTYNITINPDNTGSNVWCTSLGPVGFAKNGVAIYNALTGETTDAVVYETLDDCNGHSSPDGAYHYHQFPVCLGNLSVKNEFIGIALDGNPIYGPNASDRTELLTSADLDACHGRFVNSEYRYHITADFPYAIGCFKAQPAASTMLGQPGGGNRPPPDGNGPPPDGNRPPPDGEPPPGRKKRQAQDVTCSNKDAGGELCDCTSGTLTHCDTLRGDEACKDNDGDSDNDGDGDNGDNGDDNDGDNDGNDKTDDGDDNSATRLTMNLLLLSVIVLAVGSTTI